MGEKGHSISLEMFLGLNFQLCSLECLLPERPRTFPFHTWIALTSY